MEGLVDGCGSGVLVTLVPIVVLWLPVPFEQRSQSVVAFRISPYDARKPAARTRVAGAADLQPVAIANEV